MNSERPIAASDCDDGRASLLDVLPAGVVVVDARGRVTDCNPAAEALLGAPLVGAAWRGIVGRALAAPSGADLHEETDGVRLANGRIVNVVTSPLGSRRGQVVLLTDVTAAGAARSAIARQRRLAAIGQTVAGLSHQLRTPLASALLYVSQLEHPELSAAKRERSTAKLRGCLDHLDRLVRELLNWAGGGAMRAGDVAISELLATFRAHVGDTLGGRCRLDIVDDAGSARVRGNRDALLTALQALMENAVQACASVPRAGHLRLLARRADTDAFEITLSDDGPGMSEDLRGRVTQPFFTTRTNGTGLGLAVAEAVAKAHGGVLWIESQQGLGTTVGLRLPLAQPVTRSAMAAGAAASLERAG
ncbi:MAG: ATP-binding protein [Gammaproteobacteria bacterium]|jgi:two-component system sensor histidine kinase FlrB|nr:ATP-binding protein [Gammaproteobacteria bacterium]